MQERIIHGDLVIEDFEYVFKGDLTVNGTINIRNGSLVVEGNLSVLSEDGKDIYVSCSSIYAKSITAKTNIYIFFGNISTFKDFNCENIECYGGDICIGGNSHVKSVFCRNYLVDGENCSLDIKAENVVYIMKFSNSHSISAQEVFLGGGGDFNGGSIKTDHFEFDEHIYHCISRYPFIA